MKIFEMTGMEVTATATAITKLNENPVARSPM
jgi:hypothetical protein